MRTTSRLSTWATAITVAAALAVGAPAVATAAPLGSAAVTAQIGGGIAATSLTVHTARTLKAPKPKISGTKAATGKLTAKPGTWTAGTKLTYRWYANGKAISGATGKTLTLKSAQVGKKIVVKVTGKKSGYKTVTKSSAATRTIMSGKARPASKATCPSTHPIKGNQTTRHTSDWIYHVPGARFYKATHPEECFATETAAKKAGYRKAKV